MRRSQVPSIRKKQKLCNPSDVATSSNSSQFKSTSDFSSKLTTQTSNNQDKFQVFTVVYGTYKPGKKHKEWTNDAILVRDNKLIKIYNLEGEL